MIRSRPRLASHLSYLSPPFPLACVNRYKVCDEFDVPSSLPSSKSDGTGFYRTDVLGETLLIFRSPQEITFQGQVESTKMGEIIILNESSLEGDLSLLTKLNFSRLTSLKGLMKYRSIEINRMIFLWHHEHNFVSDSYDPTKVLVEPEWDIPIIPGMEDFVYHGRVQHEIACHIQEIPENGADVAHLDYIHGDFLLSWLRILRHTWSARWDPQHEPTGHIAKLILNQKVSIFGLSIPGTSLDSNIDQVGPGLVQLIFPTPFGRVAVIETITPICHTLQRANNVLYAEKTVPRFMAKGQRHTHTHALTQHGWVRSRFSFSFFVCLKTNAAHEFSLLAFFIVSPLSFCFVSVRVSLFSLSDGSRRSIRA